LQFSKLVIFFLFFIIDFDILLLFLLHRKYYCRKFDCSSRPYFWRWRSKLYRYESILISIIYLKLFDLLEIILNSLHTLTF
jgi:hypothetical protein